MDNAKTWLKGKKTYIVAAAAVLTTLASWADGDVKTFPALMAILGACGLGTIRAAIAKIEEMFSKA